MAQFTGQLKTNKMFASLFNMVISQQTFGTGISDLEGIYSSRKVDGTLFGDTKIYTSTDALASYDWDGTDNPGGYNLLTVKKPPAPKTDKVVIDTYRQIPLTVDNYLTKQAFMDEGKFGEFQGVILSWMEKTKSVYEHTKYTTDIIVGGLTKATSLGNISLVAPAGIAGYDLVRWRAQELYREIEDKMKELKEPARTYNDHKFLRNYVMEDFDIVVPLGILSGVRKHDIPFLYTPDEKPKFKEVHWKYFGSILTVAGTTTATNTTVRSVLEADYGKVGSAVKRLITANDYQSATDVVHVFPGDLLPNSAGYLANEAYTQKYASKPDIATDGVDVLFIHKNDYPIMSAFSVGTSFFNARRLDINHYLTFGHNNVLEAHIGEFALLKLTTKTA